MRFVGVGVRTSVVIEELVESVAAPMIRGDGENTGNPGAICRDLELLSVPWCFVHLVLVEFRKPKRGQ